MRWLVLHYYSTIITHKLYRKHQNSRTYKLSQKACKRPLLSIAEGSSFMIESSNKDIYCLRRCEYA